MPQQQEQERGVEAMNQDIHQVMRTGADPKQLTIQSMRQCRYRMPVPNHRLCESVADSWPTQPGTNLRVVSDELGVIVENEIMRPDGQVYAQGERSQY
jgi:hypothetical protein